MPDARLKRGVPKVAATPPTITWGTFTHLLPKHWAKIGHLYYFTGGVVFIVSTPWMDRRRYSVLTYSEAEGTIGRVFADPEKKLPAEFNNASHARDFAQNMVTAFAEWEKEKSND